MGRAILVIAAVALGVACAAPEPVVQSPAPAPPAADWLSTVTKQSAVELPGVTAALRSGPETVAPLPKPTSTLLVIGPGGIALDGALVVGGRIAGSRIALDATPTRRVPGGVLIIPLWERLRAANPAYRPDEAEAGTGTRALLVVADRRATADVLAQVSTTARFAGFAAPVWAARDASGKPVGLTLGGAPPCPEPAPPSVETSAPERRGSRPSKLGIGPMTALASCEQQQTDVVFSRRSEAMGMCYATAVSEYPLLSGEDDVARVSLLVSTGGAVEGGWVESRFAGVAKGIGECMLQALRVAPLPAQPGRCLLSRTVAFRAGNSGDMVLVQTGPVAPTTVPLVPGWAELTVESEALRIELGQPPPAESECPAGGRLFAKLSTTEPQAISSWLRTVIGRPDLPLGTLRLRVRPDVPWGRLLDVAGAVASTEAPPRLRVAVER